MARSAAIPGCCAGHILYGLPLPGGWPTIREIEDKLLSMKKLRGSFVLMVGTKAQSRVMVNFIKKYQIKLIHTIIGVHGEKLDIYCIDMNHVRRAFPAKTPEEATSARSLAAKKGWETRRRIHAAAFRSGFRPVVNW